MKSFTEAKELIKKLNINSAKSWKKYHLDNKPDIPYNPDRVYKEWVDWYDFLGKTKDTRKFYVNDNFFKKDSRNMYYILGFIYTDGFLNEKNNNLVLTQHNDDKYILLKILEEMQSNYTVKKHYFNNYYFSITSKEIISDLKLRGLCQKKSFTIKFPDIPNNFLPDFIRGIFDGDGCITYQKNERCYVSSFTSGSKEFIYYLLDVLRKNINEFKGNIHMINKNYTLSIGVNDTRRLRDYIYQNINNDLIFLKRKYEKFKLSGEIKVASFDKKFLSYIDAGIFMRKNNINTYRQWRKYKKENKIIDIPSSPGVVYKEYTNWSNFINQKMEIFKDPL